LLLSSGPLRYLESLIKSSCSSIEVDISYSLEKGVGVEVLSINMEHEVRLLMEFLTIKVLNSNTNFSTFFNVESIGNVTNIWVDESHDVRYLHLQVASWVEKDFQPSLSWHGSEIISEGSANLSFA